MIRPLYKDGSVTNRPYQWINISEGVGYDHIGNVTVHSVADNLPLGSFLILQLN